MLEVRDSINFVRDCCRDPTLSETAQLDSFAGTPRLRGPPLTLVCNMAEKHSQLNNIGWGGGAKGHHRRCSGEVSKLGLGVKVISNKATFHFELVSSR